LKKITKFTFFSEKESSDRGVVVHTQVAQERREVSLRAWFCEGKRNQFILNILLSIS